MDLLARLSRNLPLTLAVLALIILVVVIALVLLVRRRRLREEEAAAPDTSLAASPAAPAGTGVVVDFRQVGSHQRLSGAFRRAIAELRRHLGGRDSLYRLPWFLLVGGAGAEKSRLFADSGLNLPLGAPEESSPEQGDGCSFWFFDRGVVLDVSSEYVLRSDGKSSNDRGWRYLLSLLRENRTERPVDGVVLALSCADLLGSPEDEGARLAVAAEKGAALFRKLRQAQESLGMLFPVYVVVTGCERIPGFASFTGEVPRHLRGDLFGWSNPYAPEAAYRTEWLDEAFAQLGAGLHRAQLDAFGDQAVIEDPDGVFCFSEELQRLRGPLRVYLNQIFRASSYHDLLPLRGLYFCGRLTLAEAGVPDLLRDPAAVGGSVFVRDVFDRKVFPERDLAHPSSLALIHGDRRLKILQAAVAVLALVSTLGVFWAWWSLSRRHDNLKTFLVNTAEDLQETRDRRAADTAEHAFLVSKGFHLVESMSRLDADRFGSVFLPSSWISPFNSELRKFMVHSWDEIILRTLHQELEWKLGSVVEAARPVDLFPAAAEDPVGRVPAAGAPGDSFIAWDSAAAPAPPDLRAPGDTPELKRLNQYVAMLRELETRVGLFNRLGTTESLEDLSSVVSYLFGRELPKGFFQSSELYTKALADVRYQRFEPAKYRSSTVPREDQLAGAFFDRLFDRNPVLADLQRAAQLMEEAADSGWNPAGGGTVEALVELHTVLHRVEDELASSSEIAWMGGDTFQPGPAYEQLVQGMRSTLFLGPETAARLRKDGEQRFQRFRRTLFAVEARSTGALLQRDPKTGALSLSPPAKLLADSLDGLSKQGFVSAAGASEGRATLLPRPRVIWDTLALDQAAAFYEPYDGFIQKMLPAFSPDLRNTLEVSARNRLGARMMERAAAAQQRGPEPDASSSFLLAQALDAEVANFQAAAPALAKLAGLFEKLGLLTSREQVNAAQAAQGQQILLDANRLLVLEAPYTPKGNGFDWWDGDPKPALKAYAADDDVELAAYLAAQRTSVAEISSRYAEPVMQALGGRTGPGSRELRSSMDHWSAISEQLKAYKAKEPGNSVAALEELIAKDLIEIAPANCSSRITPRMLTEPAGDFFALRRAALRHDVWERCLVLAGSKAAEGYRKIETFFNQRLAGHFPFLKGLPTRLDTEADPDDVRAFFTLYDRYAPIVSAVPDEDRPPGTGAFIERMEKVRAFFKSFLEDPLRPEGPSFNLAVRFRENRRFEKGADQIIRWSLASGKEAVIHPNTVPTVPWTYGTPLRIELQWAKDSALSPVESTDLPGVRVAGQTAVLEFNNRWSLLTLLRLAGADGDPGVEMVRLSVATRPKDKPEAAAELAQVYVRLGVRAPEPKEKPAPAPAPADAAKAAAPPAGDLDVPFFPAAAPRWPDEKGQAL